MPAYALRRGRTCACHRCRSQGVSRHVCSAETGNATGTGNCRRNRGGRRGRRHSRIVLTAGRCAPRSASRDGLQREKMPASLLGWACSGKTTHFSQFGAEKPIDAFSAETHMLCLLIWPPTTRSGEQPVHNSKQLCVAKPLGLSFFGASDRLFSDQPSLPAMNPSLVTAHRPDLVGSAWVLACAHAGRVGCSTAVSSTLGSVRT